MMSRARREAVDCGLSDPGPVKVRGWNNRMRSAYSVRCRRAMGLSFKSSRFARDALLFFMEPPRRRFFSRKQLLGGKSLIYLGVNRVNFVISISDSVWG